VDKKQKALATLKLKAKGLKGSTQLRNQQYYSNLVDRMKYVGLEHMPEICKIVWAHGEVGEFDIIAIMKNGHVVVWAVDEDRDFSLHFYATSIGEFIDIYEEYIPSYHIEQIDLVRDENEEIIDHPAFYEMMKDIEAEPTAGIFIPGASEIYTRSHNL
ncbi:MAG: hypothetical protein KAJ55_12720, partial [Anaerolineales bacterium]|nr:hypothetical protein [Anaerolineales bacterium]